MAKFYYGGQAVMEGVMMRGRTSAAVGIRRPEGSIYIYEEALDPRLYKNRVFRLPFVRGAFLLWEMLVLGTRLMTLSANIATGAIDPDAPPTSKMAEECSGTPGGYQVEEEKLPQIGGLGLILIVLVSIGFAVVLFFLLPLFITGLLHNQIGQGWPSLMFEGVIRLVILVGYLYLSGFLPDIERIYGYHGAEHKAINAMEQGDPLDIPHVRRASRVHTRCGTGFLLIVAVVSILVFALVGTPSLPIKILSRIVLIPVVAGIAYELMRLGAANYHFRVVRWLLAPGLALQGLTTREPDDGMIECAIAALRRVIQRDKIVDTGFSETDAGLPPLVGAR